MDVHTSHRSRRSFPNLQHLSLAPLSTRFPIEGDDFEDNEEEEGEQPPSSSYIQSKSTPATPSILSRSSSRRRKSKKRVQEYFPPELNLSDLPITKAKSATTLDYPAGRRHSRTPTGSTLLPLSARHGPRNSYGNDEWYHRAGLAIASETRETKGQGWLLSRDSSTSLVGPNDYHERRGSSEDGIVAPHYSRVQSRGASRAVSRATSRRGSVAGGSKTGFMTPMNTKTPGSVFESQEGYFDDVDALAEPDFVETEEDGHTDDEEVSRLARQKGLGFGGLVDRLVGFSLFNVDEDAEETEEDDAELTAEEALKKKQAELKRRREELARAARSSAEATSRAEQVQPARQGEEGGWQDAAWLLSVASKVLY